MRRMIMDASQLLDHVGDPRQGPQIGLEPVRVSAVAQDLIQALPLRLVDAWLSTGSTRAPKGAGASTLPEPIPAQDALSTGVKSASHGGHDGARGEQLGGLFPSLFEGLKIPTRAKCNSLHGLMVARREPIVTLLCKTQ